MDWSDVFEVVADRSNDFGDDDKPNKKPKILAVFDVLLLIGIFWGFVEFFSVITFFQTLLFLCVFFAISTLISLLIISTLYKQNFVNQLSQWS